MSGANEGVKAGEQGPRDCEHCEHFAPDISSCWFGSRSARDANGKNRVLVARVEPDWTCGDFTLYLGATVSVEGGET